jgi:hypothetical protein
LFSPEQRPPGREDKPIRALAVRAGATVLVLSDAFHSDQHSRFWPVVRAHAFESPGSAPAVSTAGQARVRRNRVRARNDPRRPRSPPTLMVECHARLDDGIGVPLQRRETRIVSFGPSHSLAIVEPGRGFILEDLGPGRHGSSVRLGEGDRPVSDRGTFGGLTQFATQSEVLGSSTRP